MKKPTSLFSFPVLINALLIFIVFSVAFIPAASYGAAPTITTFSPASGAIGSSVTITGTGFNATANQNIVFFGATQATVTTASATSLTVTVPVGATYQYISVTNLSVNLTGYSSKPFIVTLAGNIAFANKQDFTTGTQPFSISIGDIDGDGKPDLAVANNGSNTVSVFRNTSTAGATGFAAKVDFTTGTNPRSVSIGDIDGDGKPDLAVTNQSSNTISVFRNTSTSGTVSFAAKVDFTTGTTPYSVSIGDIDGDGKPDLAVANQGSNTVSVLRSTSISGTISFAAKVDFTTGTSPFSVSIGDIDGDGKPDLAVANSNSNTVSVFRNTSTSGTVSFAAKVDFTTGTSPNSVSIGDIDGDGKPDLAVTNQGNNSVSVFRNTSTSGTVSFASKVDFSTGTSPRSPSIGDIDGDGKPDLAVANATSNTISVFCNTSTSGTVSFAARVNFTTGASPGPVSIGDIDGDGKPDLAVPNVNSNTISVIRQIVPVVITAFSPASGAIGSSVTISGTGFNATANQNIVFFGATQAAVTAASATSLTVTVPIGATFQYISVTNLDVNLTAYSKQAFITTFSCGGTVNTNSFATKVDFATATGPYAVEVVDLDGDGKSDLAASTNGSAVSVFRNTGVSGTISFASKQDFTVGQNAFGVVSGDLDGDGKQDLAVVHFSNTLAILRNTSTSGSISFATGVNFTTGTTPRALAIVDMDGDGKLDVITANQNANTVSVFRNLSTSGTISFGTKVDFTTGTTPAKVVVGDIDGDGKPDLAIANVGSATISVLRNTSTNGAISFASKIDFTTGTNPYSLALGDLDGDSSPDIAVSNRASGTVSIFKNVSTSGTISFDPKVDYASGTNPSSVSLSDVDGDGKVDVTVGNDNANSVSVLKNTSTVGTISLSVKVAYTTGGYPSVAVGDIDGDGKPDIVTANSTSNTVSILRNTIYVGPTPPSGGGGYGLCANQVPYTFSVTPPSGCTVDWYSASSGGSLLLSGSSSYTASVAGNYYAESRNTTSGCVSATRTLVSISITANPAPPVSGGDQTICAGDAPAVLTASSPEWVVWYDAPTGGNVIANGQTYTVSTTGTYYAQSVGMVSPNCSSTSRTPVSLTVNPNPTVNLGADVTQCGGSTLLDAGNAGSTFAWFPSGTTQTISVSSTGTYSVVVTDGNSCSNSDLIDVTINALPIVTANASATTVCAGTTVTLTGGGADSYTWTGGVTNGVGFVASGTQTYTVTGTDGSSCTNTATQTITVLASPNVSMNQTNSSCAGSTGSATAIASGGISPYTYSWSTGGTTSSISNIAAANYTCTVTGNNGCAKTNTVTVGAFPCGATNLAPAYCGITLTTLNQYVYCVQVAGATNYHYKVTHPSSGFTGNYYRQSSYTDFQLTRIAGIQYGKTYIVEVRAYIGGSWSNYGTACNLTTPATMPAPQLRAEFCPVTLTTLDQTLSNTGVSGATNYQYKVVHAASGFTGFYTRNHSLTDFQMTRVAGVQYGKTYTVEVRAYVGGVWGSYGTACSVTTPPTIPLTELRPADCGATLAAVSTVIYCNSVAGATNYQYKVENTPSSFSIVYTRNASLTNFQLSWVTGTKVNTAYTISVRSYVSGVWSSYGNICSVTTGPVMRLEGEDESINFSLNVYPNPIEEHVLHYALDGVETDQQATIEVYDMVGTKIYSEQIMYQPGADAVINIDDKFSKGVYFLHATINGRRFYQKFVAIK